MDAQDTKLTNAQRKLLAEANNIDGVNCVESYAPAKALVRLGYAEWLPRRFSSCLRTTDAGREALAKVSAP